MAAMSAAATTEGITRVESAMPWRWSCYLGAQQGAAEVQDGGHQDGVAALEARRCSHVADGVGVCGSVDVVEGQGQGHDQDEGRNHGRSPLRRCA